ncbi:MAG: metalloregulator ArsR/SmtB family transcription factor [Ktedonobacterales bacterium]
MDTTTHPSTRATPTAASNERRCEGPVAAPNHDAREAVALVGRLKALADPTRLGMLDLLVTQGRPLCVCDITDQFAQRQPTISHHLRILRRAGLIGGEKRGVWSYYWATEEGTRTLSLVKTLV